MSQQDEIAPWVLVSSIKEDTNPQDIESIAPQIASLVDEWQSMGRIMWSGSFDDDKTGMAVFEATKQEADMLFKKYGDICSGVLNYYLYKWDAMPILSVLSQNK